MPGLSLYILGGKYNSGLYSLQGSLTEHLLETPAVRRVLHRRGRDYCRRAVHGRVPRRSQPDARNAPTRAAPRAAGGPHQVRQAAGTSRMAPFATSISGSPLRASARSFLKRTLPWSKSRRHENAKRTGGTGCRSHSEFRHRHCVGESGPGKGSAPGHRGDSGAEIAGAPRPGREDHEGIVGPGEAVPRRF